MPKRKRSSSQDKLEKYRRKVRKIEEKQRRLERRRQLLESSPSESDNESTNNMTELEPPATDTEGLSASIPPADDSAVNIDPVPTQEEISLPELDPDLLLALGEATDSSPKYGPKIHDVLAKRWEPVLKKGLPKELKDQLLKDNLVPENCALLQAPVLNVEVEAAISETARSRDKKKEASQQQLGVGIAVINKAMTTLLMSDNKVEAIKVLSDGCRILTDLHYLETQARINVINYSLAKPFLNVVQDNERDETLYGVKLSEKIKASKVIEKQGLQIKKYVKPQKNTATPDAAVNTRPQYHPGPPASNQGNWSGPSRFQQNRGGRRGQRRQPATTTSRKAPPPVAGTATGQAKTRAQTRQ